jgi:hypothetical protein
VGSYTPSPDDLAEPVMPADWVRVADQVMPFNQERLIEQATTAQQEFSTAMERLRGVLETSTTQIRALVDRLASLSRLDGYHRTGHRHAGTRDHALRFAPGRRDLPLGERTAAKASAARVTVNVTTRSTGKAA